MKSSSYVDVLMASIMSMLVVAIMSMLMVAIRSMLMESLTSMLMVASRARAREACASKTTLDKSATWRGTVLIQSRMEEVCHHHYQTQVY